LSRIQQVVLQFNRLFLVAELKLTQM